MKISNKNDELKRLISELKKASIENKVKIWKRVAKDLEKPSRERRIVNVQSLSLHAKKGEIVIVPGKVLGSGELNEAIKVAALSFSEEAQRKISGKGEFMTIYDLVKNNPSGKKVRILG